MKRYLPVIVGFVVLLIFLGTQCLFIVNQTEKALIIQLGEPVDRVLGPGIHAKLPFIQTVFRFDARVLNYEEARPAQPLTSDKKKIVVDNYVRWRIVDPLKFYRTVRGISGAQARLGDVVNSQLQAQVGRHTLTEAVSSRRSGIMDDVTKRVSDLMKKYGIEVLDVRIKRVDLPTENQMAVFGRMRAERERQAKQYRSEGMEESTKLRAQANKDQAIIMAEANQRASIIRGEGDAEAARIFAEAFSQAPEFYEFQRGLEALKKSLEKNTRIILSDDNTLLRPLN